MLTAVTSNQYFQANTGFEAKHTYMQNLQPAGAPHRQRNRIGPLHKMHMLFVAE